MMKNIASFCIAFLIATSSLALGANIARKPPPKACSTATPTPTACPTTYLPCKPTIIMDYVVRNGAFDQPTKIPVGATRSSSPGWTPARLQNATIDFVGRPAGPNNVNSNGAAYVYSSLVHRLSQCLHIGVGKVLSHEER